MSSRITYFNKIKNKIILSGGHKMKSKTFLVLIISLLLSLSTAYAATVSHPASQITPGGFQVGSYNFPGVLTVGTALFVNASSGNVGIGTTSPAVDLHTYRDGSSNQIRIETVNSGTASLSINDASGGTILLRADANPSYFNTGGNVGIGTTSPAEKLEVNGHVRARSFIAVPQGNTLPTCDYDHRGQLYTIGSGGTDHTYICTMRSSAYVWKRIDAD